MGRASRAKKEREVCVLDGRIIQRGRRFKYRGSMVGSELLVTGLPSIPNPPPEELQPFELVEDPPETKEPKVRRRSIGFAPAMALLAATLPPRKGN